MPDFTALQPYLPWALCVLGVGGSLALIVAVAVFLAAAARRYGQRTNTPAADRSQARRDRALFAAAFIAAAIVYSALIAGSFEGLTAWARDTLDWTGWQQYIVPLSVDGLGTAAGVLAFRAVRRKTSPYACYAMVWGATATSMTVNAIQGGKHGAAAAFYMAFLSLAVMAMFHLFLGQFQAGAEYVGRKYPRFGLRWATYTGPTLLDFLCWVNHPPTGDLEPSVANAVEHREAHRQRTAERKHERQLVSARRAAELAATEPATRPEPEPVVEVATQTEAAPVTRPEAEAATAAPSGRKSTTGNPKTAAAVARAQQRWPGETQKQIAARLSLSDKTVRNYWTHPSNVTLIHPQSATAAK